MHSCDIQLRDSFINNNLLQPVHLDLESEVLYSSKFSKSLTDMNYDDSLINIYENSTPILT